MECHRIFEICMLVRKLLKLVRIRPIDVSRPIRRIDGEMRHDDRGSTGEKVESVDVIDELAVLVIDDDGASSRRKGRVQLCDEKQMVNGVGRYRGTIRERPLAVVNGNLHGFAFTGRQIIKLD